MKIRFAPNQITFRIKQNELASLQEGNHLTQTLPLPGGSFLSFTILKSKEQEGMTLAYQDTTCSLEVSPKVLAHLATTPSKEGYSSQYLSQGKNVGFSLEVDMFSKKPS